MPGLRCGLGFAGQFAGELDRGDGAFRAGKIFAGNFESGAVIWACAREGETEGDVDPLMESMELKGD